MKDELYKAGDKVYHRLFGEGKVISIYKAHSGTDVVEVKFNRFETNRSILAESDAIRLPNLCKYCANEIPFGWYCCRRCWEKCEGGK